MSNSYDEYMHTAESSRVKTGSTLRERIDRTLLDTYVIIKPEGVVDTRTLMNALDVLFGYYVLAYIKIRYTEFNKFNITFLTNACVACVMALYRNGKYKL